MKTTDADDISAHRTRSNRRPEPDPHIELVKAVEAVYRDVERSEQ